MRRSWFVHVASSVFALSACSGQSSSNPALPGNTSALPSTSRKIHERTLPSQLLFVPAENGTIDIYPLPSPSKSGPVATITGLHGFQDGMVVDAQGDLFAVNNGSYGNDDYVSEYAPPYDSAPTILNTSWMSETFFPIGVAVDASGTVYVTDCGAYCHETPAIFVYPPGATSPASAITSARFNSLAGVTADAKGDVYVVNWNDSTYATDVFKVDAGTTKPKPLYLHGLVTGSGGNGVTLDSNGNLYASADSSGSSFILEYKPGKHNASRMIDSFPFLDFPLQLEVGPDKNLYVPVNCAAAPCTQVYAYKPKAGKPFESIGSSTGLIDTFGVATAPNLLLQGSHR